MTSNLPLQSSGRNGEPGAGVFDEQPSKTKQSRPKCLPVFTACFWGEISYHLHRAPNLCKKKAETEDQTFAIHGHMQIELQAPKHEVV